MAHQTNPSKGPKIIFHLPFISFMLLFLVGPTHAQVHNLQTYIIHLHPQFLTTSGFSSRLQWHLSFLERTILSNNGTPPSSRLLYSYHSAIEGFAARLSEHELAVLRATPGVIAILPDHRLQLQTTYSYKFLGLDSSGDSPWARSKFGQGMIIGVLDTGIWPESPSFNDHNMPPVPNRWRGICQEGQSFNASACNRKLIGARFYHKDHRKSPSSPSITEYLSPRDAHGHGTHTSSIAAGNSVIGASVVGNGAGEARGMAPGAHIAIYKVCWFGSCFNSDILAGMDDGIRDGVDVLSLSLGGFPLPLYYDSIAISSFRATERGILVVCAAGNNGPIPYSVANEAPWITTVGASTVDRRFPAIVRMGNGQILYGESMYPRTHLSNDGKELDLIYGGIDGMDGAEFCYNGTLLKNRIGGKMVVCDRGPTGRAVKGEIVKESGGAAMILANTEINEEEDSVDVHVLPATLISYAESIRLKLYINSTIRPTARIEFEGTVIGKSRAPAVALFSSRGPSLTNPSIIKPDLIAPGVNIIAAWPENLGPTSLPEDSRRVNFTVLSGTSMACPHVSGIAALLRSAHPSWSPAAIKSAIMTTADDADHLGNPIMDGSKPAGIFAMGAGHVNPRRAMDPGLIYDIKPDEYIIHLCNLGYTTQEIFAITHRNVNCYRLLSKNVDFSLNYPSISVIFKRGTVRKMIRRWLTNVGPPNSTYLLQGNAPQWVKMRVRPERLTFSHLYERKDYRVWFISRKRIAEKKVSFSQGLLTWVHNHQSQYKVRSPISVTWAV
ncbi:subtilisin-like protease SBT1.2 [Magnolia sinica]|uniref:subtilisin-like protease SBT1.2 n=1 Tax=Magnolia sinica TaxID=86752 RepID=UPI00265B6280|nr:subtilisin-like protease SBT1.2 [Magnolia sinica]